MGNCTPHNLQDQNTNLNGVYQEVLKCPSNHWLAMYQTSQCTLCQNKNILSLAQISCTICTFSLCQNCFTRKFLKWEKSVKSLSVEHTAEMSEKLLEELQNIVKKLCEQKGETGYERLQKYLQQQAFEHSKLRMSNCPMNLEQSLEIRVNTLAKLCLKAYKSRLPVHA